MKLKFLADEDLRRAIVLGVRRREPSVSFIESFEVGSNGKDDLTVLEIVGACKLTLFLQSTKEPRNRQRFGHGYFFDSKINQYAGNMRERGTKPA